MSGSEASFEAHLRCAQRLRIMARRFTAWPRRNGGLCPIRFIDLDVEADLERYGARPMAGWPVSFPV